MSEGDNENNQPSIKPPESTDESEVDLSEITETSVTSKVINLFGAAEEIDREKYLPPQPTGELDSAIISEVDDNTGEELFPPVADSNGQDRSKDADWFALAQKMRQRNRFLLDQVNELKQALRDKQQGLTVELMRSQERDALLQRQSDELQGMQGQLTRLFHTLESSHQAASRQQILIETLSEQLQSSQERVAQLERECALTQQRYNEQSHQLLQSTNTCRELKNRLHRQQQQTLQFKVALEKCLEMGNSNATDPQEILYQSGMGTGSVVPKTQPIQPWSAQGDFLTDKSGLDSLWNRPIKLESFSTLPLSDLDILAPKPIEQSEQFSTADTSSFIETTASSARDNIARELAVEEQLLAEMTALAEASGLSAAISDLSVEKLSNGILESGDNLEGSDESVSDEIGAGEIVTQFHGTDDNSWHDTANEESDESDDVIFPQANWPSPVLYPLRRPKKLKSLAAIDLPTFPHYRTT